MQNSNYQEQIPPRRRIIFVQRNRTFNEFQKNQNRIIKEYEKSSKELMIQSFSIIAAKLFGEKSNAFLQKKSINIMQEPNPIENLNQHIQKKIQGEEQAKKQMQPFSMKKKNTIGYNKKSPEKQNKVSKNHNKLINQLSRLSVDEKFSDQNQSTNDRQSNYTNLLKFDEDLLKNKTISQLLHESNMKSKNRKEVFEPIAQSQSSQQYQMTDYSSNESSNDDKNYEQIYLYQDQIKPLFGNLFINKSQTLSDNQNSTYCYESKFQFQKKTQQLNFQNKKLLESPRKTKSQMKKRLFIREKKIPRWAENLKQVSEIVEKQRKELDFLNLYGIFVVQNLQTNTVFGINEDYKRTSSARWYKNKNGYVC